MHTLRRAARISSIGTLLRRCSSPTQPREYFYYLNDHGNLYHVYQPERLLGGEIPVGPAHLREEKFLDFFFALLKENKSGRYEEEFPWLSLCRGEQNYMKASDRPVVFTELVTENGTPRLLYGGGTKLSTAFLPDELAVCSEGRIYHPAKLGTMGLLSCHCAMRLGLDSIWDDNAEEEPYLEWEGRKHPLRKITPFPAKFI